MANIRVTQMVGQQQEMTRPAPNAIHKKSRLHIFFTPNTPQMLYLHHTMHALANRYSAPSAAVLG